MLEFSPEINYRFKVIEAINFLNQTKNELFVKVENIAMADENNDSSFKEGDEIPADISYFKNCEDQNAQTLVQHLQTIQDTINYLMNINNKKLRKLILQINYL